jgi:uncharacterized membrane protein
MKRPRRPVSRVGASRLGTMMPVLAGVAVLALAVAVSLAVGRANLESAKESRLDDRATLVERFAATGSAGYAGS